MHLDIMVEALHEQNPEFAAINRRHQHSYAELVIRSASPGSLKHNRAGKRGIPDNAIPLESRDLERKFGRQGFERINGIAGCLDRNNYFSIERRETYAYWLSDQGRAVLDRTHQLAADNQANLVDKNGRRITRRENAIYTSRDSAGNNAVTTARVPWSVPINVEDVNHTLNVGVENIFLYITEDRASYVSDQLRAIRSDAQNDNVGRGRIPLTYKEAPSGRLYGFGNLSLQNAAGETRLIAQNGAYDYDFENCHFRILKAKALEAGINTPAIDQYIQDRDQYREELANDLSITPKQVKNSLLAMLYGAKNCLYPACAIAGIVGAENARAFIQHPRYSALRTETDEVGNWLRDQARRHPRTGATINCRGKACIGTTRQQLAHLLQGYESEMLHALLEVYGDQILVLQHDGFAMFGRVETDEMQQIVYRATGFEMPVTREQLVLEGIQ